MKRLKLLTWVIVVMTLCVSVMSLTVGAAAYLPGDLNGDGYVNTTDVVLLRRYIAGGYDVEITPPPSTGCGHAEVIDAAKAATCTQTGLTEGKHCERCGEVLIKQEVIPVKGHNYVNGVCSLCGESTVTPNSYFVFSVASDGGCSVKARDPSNMPSTVIIPESYNGKPVTTIPNNAFMNCSTITKLVLPDCVTSINNYAFNGCSSLKTLVVSESLRDLWPNSFTGIANLEYTVEDGVRYLGSRTNPHFLLVRTLDYEISKAVIHPDTKVIGYGAFRNCAALTDITIPEGVKVITNSVFSDCTSLNTLTIPSSVTYLSYAFAGGCDALTTFEVQEGNAVYFSKGNCVIEKASGTLIAGCNTSVIPADGSVTAIGQYAFYNNLIENIVLPEGITSIEGYAFRDCDNLTSLIIPASVKSIGNGFISQCDSLSDLQVAEGNTTFRMENDCLINIENDTVIFGLASAKEVPDGVKQIGGSAFNGMMIQEMTLPDTLTQILIDGFRYCSALEKITFSKNLTYIGNYSFQRCTSLTEIDIPATVNYIGQYAFQGCSSLKEVIIPEKVTKININTFANCSKLTSVTIPASVTSIGNNAFLECTALVNVYYYGTEEQWKAITVGSGNDALLNATVVFNTGETKESLAYTELADGTLAVSGIGTVTSTEIVIPAEANGKKVTQIAAKAFADNTQITQVVISDGITLIASDAFYNCTSLKKVVLPKTLTQCGNRNIFTGIASEAFTVEENGGMYLGTAENPHFLLVTVEDKPDVTEFVAHKDTKFIGHSAFRERLYLESVVVPEGVEHMSYFVFDNSKLLKKVSIPSTAVNMGYNFFGGCPALVEVTVHPDNPVYMSVDNCIINKETKTLWIGCVSSVIPDDGSVTSIGTCAFQTVPFAHISIPEGITNIQAYAFRNCSALESIVIPSSVKSVLTDAFKDCKLLKRVDIADLASWCDISIKNNLANPFCPGNASLYLNDQLITDLVIPDGVTNIKWGAFWGCGSIESVSIPNSVTKIDSCAFRMCPNLADVTFPDSITSIGNYMFQKCGSLTSVSIPVSVISIGLGSFENCTALATINYGGTEEQWAAVTIAERNDALLNATVVFNAGVATESLAYTELADGTLAVSGIGTVTATEIVIPEEYNGKKVTRIYSYAFKNCTSIVSISIPDTVTTIGSNAFYGCTALSSIAIPSGVSTIYYHTFDGCRKLREITIPGSVTSIGASAFHNTNLNAIYYEGTFEDWLKIEINNTLDYNSVIRSAFVYYYSENQPSENGNWWHYVNGVPVIWEDVAGNATFSEYFIFELQEDGTYGIKIKDMYNMPAHIVLPSTYNGKAVTNICQDAFNGCLKLQSITISDNITTIGKYAFDGCNYITSVSISNSVKNIGSFAFSDCVRLNHILIPDSVIQIDYGAFHTCRGLTSITIPGNVTNISDSTFLGCQNLVDVVIQNGVTSIESYAFYKCDRLANVTIADSVISIGSYAFGLCDALESITIPGSVITVDESAFVDCTKLTSVIFQDGVKSIGSHTFTNCPNLKDVTLPSSMRSIGDYAFSGCESLEKITIPHGVESIGEGAFSGCMSLMYITIPNTMTSISEWTFENCIAMKWIEIPSSVTSIGSCAFYSCFELASVTIPKNVTVVSRSSFDGCSKLASITIPSSVTKIESNAFYLCRGLKSIYYTGTKAQWNNIPKEVNWNKDTASYTIYCTDGDITK